MRSAYGFAFWLSLSGSDAFYGLPVAPPSRCAECISCRAVPPEDAALSSEEAALDQVRQDKINGWLQLKARGELAKDNMGKLLGEEYAVKGEGKGKSRRKRKAGGGEEEDLNEMMQDMLMAEPKSVQSKPSPAPSPAPAQDWRRVRPREKAAELAKSTETMFSLGEGVQLAAGLSRGSDGEEPAPIQLANEAGEKKMPTQFAEARQDYETCVASGNPISDKALARSVQKLCLQGRLGMSLVVHQWRKELLSTGKLHDHDIETSVGLAVACCNAGKKQEAHELVAWLETCQDVPSKLLRDEIYPELIGMRLASGDVPGGLEVLNEQVLDTEAVPLSIPAYNQVIRHLGKACASDEVFAVLAKMKAHRLRPSAETYEMLSNAMVKDASLVLQARAMEALPVEKNTAVGEVVFVGRSNSGKSSLVNCLLNRKTLARMSAKSGSTKEFNYYLVNGQYKKQKIPSFHLVDVPGLGYAEASEGTMDSWRSTLERYLAVREPLKMVLHLIEAKAGLQASDLDIMRMVQRGRGGGNEFDYVICLTKADKVTQGAIGKVEASVKTAVDEACGGDATFLATSSKSKRGVEDLWLMIANASKVIS
ncbi:unnamed protein product [Chrysoparadoxa australica]